MREAGATIGTLQRGVANAVGLPTGLAVHPALGDHQASYLGSVADRTTDVLVNVGTGAQVAVFTPGVVFQPPVELRPFPFAGNLLSNVGLPGGWSYQLLEQFFASAIADLTGAPPQEKLYGLLNRLAEQIPAGADGLKCTPTFSGTRSDATIRGSFTQISPRNLTPAHFTRALLEGMADGLREGLGTIRGQAPEFQPRRLVAAGNGLRENALLSRLVAAAFGLPLVRTVHREEAAVGAALAAGVAVGVFADAMQAGKCLRYVKDEAEINSPPPSPA